MEKNTHHLKHFFFAQSHHYSTLSEALGKMNFECAVEDHNCFPFVCNVRKLNLDLASKTNVLHVQALVAIFAGGAFTHSTATLHKLVHRVTERVVEQG